MLSRNDKAMLERIDQTLRLMAEDKARKEGCDYDVAFNRVARSEPGLIRKRNALRPPESQQVNATADVPPIRLRLHRTLN